jgi:3-hydroxy-9,10-secoandrosta-1,3,5(10)-triene-9,17-dione monooxygenase reductase component
MTIDSALFRSVLGRFATGVTVVTTRDAEGRDHGMTVSAFSSVSLDPPLVLCCIERRTAMHAVLERAQTFAVNILSASQEALSRRFSEREHERFDGIGYERGQSGAALLEGVLGYLECRIVARHEAGDHTIVVGDARSLSCNLPMQNLCPEDITSLEH